MESERPSFGANLVKTIEGRELRQARGILVVLGVISIVTELLRYQKLGELPASGNYAIVGTTAHFSSIHQLQLVALAGAGVGVLYVLCGVAVFRKPVLATVVGFAMFLATLALQAIVDVRSLYSDVFSIGVHLAILIGLVSAMQFARIYARNQKLRQDFPAAKVVSK